MAVFKKNENKSFAFVENIENKDKANNIDEFIENAKGSKKTFQNIKGRPPVDDRYKKTEQVMIYLTKDQKNELVKKAKENNLSISKYIAIKVFGID